MKGLWTNSQNSKRHLSASLQKPPVGKHNKWQQAFPFMRSPPTLDKRHYTLLWTIKENRYQSILLLKTTCQAWVFIGKTPVIIILWWPITKMFTKACFLIQPLEQEDGCQKCSISLCSKVFIVRRAGLMRSQQDPEMWWSVPFTCAWLYMSFLLFCLIFLYLSQYSFLFWIMYLL